MRRIEIDEEVWREMQRAARPLIDSPNTVLRRLFGLDNTDQANEGHGMLRTATDSRAREANHHQLVSARHCLANQEIWWYGIPPLGKKYHPADSVTFRLDNFWGKKTGELTIELDERFLERIDRAPKDKKGYTHVKIVRRVGENKTTMYFGRKDAGAKPEIVTVREV
jgi:hypothetical protein